ncbi:YezD family protein [Sphingomonas piscis]|uniref:YezD family protein n=1 Tax=Sphingomonas piscis TaxID=2714943 RepID=A0A6G7YN21_9SPHN|nr:YezD family protein [Sphingomonas piscis]QIK78138.1 YezD family protein [Sphingomonas piscis]
MIGHEEQARSGPGSREPDIVEELRHHLERIRYGSIAITIHNGRVVQFDVTEKTRLA